MFGIEEVAEQRKPDLGIIVREILRLEVIERVVHGFDTAEQDWYDHHGAMRGGHALGEVEPRQPGRRQQQRDELIDDRHRHVGRGRERETEREDHPPAGRTVQWAQQESERDGGEQADGAEVGGARRTIREPAQPFRHRRAIADRLLERRLASVDEVEAHVRLECRGTAAHGRGTGGVDRGGCDFLFRHPAAPGEPLYRVAIVIARAERHRRVHTGRIAAQDGFGETRLLDEIAPVDVADRAEAGDAVGHHELAEREALGGALHGLLHAHHVLADPLLQPEQRREVGAAAAHLLQESREERGRQLPRLVHEVGERTREHLGTRIVGGEQTRHPCVGVHRVARIARGALRHVPDVLQEAHAQHRGHRPQFAHRQRRDALVLAHHQLERRRVQAPIRVGDEFDDDLVDARIAGEGACRRQLRQLVVEVGGQGGAHFADLRGHHVVVVQEPVAGRTHGDA